MRNELDLSNEVALDGPSWHVCYFDEEAYPFVLQASDQVRKGSCKQTDNLRPRDPLSGRWYLIAIVSVFAASSFC
jgi:hypothetical protein